jgi:hypothetical protein
MRRAVVLALAGRVQQPQPLGGQGGLEAGAVAVPVGDEDLPGPVRGQGGVCRQDGEQGLAFVGFGAGQREGDREALGIGRPERLRLGPPSSVVLPARN